MDMASGKNTVPNQQASDIACEQELRSGDNLNGATTSDYYQTHNVPNRFDNPDWFQGYGGQKQHAMYRTSATDYGSRAPSVHTMPTCFHGRSQKFSLHLGNCGMYKNHSLNTALDQSRV